MATTERDYKARSERGGNTCADGTGCVIPAEELPGQNYYFFLIVT